jgi:short-subunit dehydrogenase
MTNGKSATGETALITGASGGIGLELVRLFASDKYNLVLVARNSERLEKIAAELRKKNDISVMVLAQDLADPTTPGEIYDELQRQNISVDILVNNAGFATYGFFCETDEQKELDLLQVNIVALTHLTKLFLPPMLARKSGKILNVASTAAFQPGPLMAVYFASKAYVLSFSEALFNECAGSGVTVTALCPGPTRSGFQERAAMTESKIVQGEIMDAATVAEQGYRALMRGRCRVVTGFNNRVWALAAKLLPTATTLNLVRRAQERVGH